MANFLNAKAAYTFKIKLEQIGKNVTRGVSQQLKVDAEALADVARLYAPVDKENLENAIRVKQDGGGRNELGQFSRVSYIVYVEGNANGGGKHVGSYAWQMHEMLAPYGTGEYNLGPKSREKDGGSGIVGGKYMERAFTDCYSDIVDGAHECVRRALRGNVNIGVSLIKKRRHTR